tara:strand:- start:184 stop:843 length:660 start_codon:yes stop_codon:yes gene_type:complete
MAKTNKNNLYDEPVKAAKPVEDEGQRLVNVENDQILYREIDYAMDIGDSVVYLCGEIGEYSSFDFMTRCRTILKTREDGNNLPLNVILNSAGGDLYEMFAIIDYMSSLSWANGETIPVNIVCRGQAMSAAAMILACGTGQRIASKHSTIMFHEASAFQVGKHSDIQAAAKYQDILENNCNILLGEKTKKDAAWWAEKTKTDMFLTPADALELGIIDKII